MPKIKPSPNVILKTLLRRPGERFAYYFWDNDEWEHTAELIKILRNAENSNQVAYLGGNWHGLGRYACVKSGFLLPEINCSLQQMRI